MITRFVPTGPTIRILLYDLQPHPFGPPSEKLIGCLSSPPFMVSVTERHDLAFKYAAVVDVLLLRCTQSTFTEQLQQSIKTQFPTLCTATILPPQDLDGWLPEANHPDVLLPEDPDLLLFQRGLQGLLRKDHRFERMVRGPLTIHYPQRMVTVGGLLVRLEEKEMELLYQLALHPGVLCTREQLLQALWLQGDSKLNKVDAVVFTLRRKIGSQFIRVVRNHGYVFEM